MGTGGTAREVVERLRAGDRDAFATLYDEYGDAVYGLCLSVLRDPDEAADVKHDTFVVALRASHSSATPSACGRGCSRSLGTTASAG